MFPKYKYSYNPDPVDRIKGAAALLKLSSEGHCPLKPSRFIGFGDQTSLKRAYLCSK